MVRSAPTLIVGAARSGRSVARLLANLGRRALLTDDAAKPTDLPAGVEFVSPAAADALVGRSGELAELVVSPGVAAGHRLVRAALERGTPVRSELAVAAEHVAGRVIAVTGTNGKSTVTTLVASALRQAGREVFAGGNLGRPLSEAAGGRFDDLVIEISSFQLEWPHTLVPALAAVLNVTEDHLDRHGTMDAYENAKLQIFRNMGAGGHAVFCRDETWWRSKTDAIDATISTFGRAALGAGEVGTIYSIRPRQVRIVGEKDVELEFSGPWPSFPHDVENVAASAEIARLAGVPLAVLETAVAGFEPLPHRLALVGTHRGVRYFDDSKATNVGATMKSLEAFDAPVILLLGGSKKGTRFDALARAAGRVRLVVAYGAAADEIEAGLGRNLRIERAAGFDAAFALAAERASPGDIVLLAPACASFDEFRDYAHRGDRFVANVERLARSA